MGLIAQREARPSPCFQLPHSNVENQEMLETLGSSAHSQGEPQGTAAGALLAALAPPDSSSRAFLATVRRIFHASLFTRPIASTLRHVVWMASSPMAGPVLGNLTKT